MAVALEGRKDTSKGDKLTAALFTGALFLSAFLLFLIQPVFAKMMLPRLGGAPAVWNTCMVFFQMTLLAGYCYAHASPLLLGVARQTWVHLGLLMLPFWFLPIQLSGLVEPPLQVSPVLFLLSRMVVSIGLPFFVVSTSAPLIQRWFSFTSHPYARDPYFLYAASNCGSLAALLSYPVIIEPRLRLSTQNTVWALGYGLFVVLIVGCFLVTRRSLKANESGERIAGNASQAETRFRWVSPDISWNRRLRWILLSLVPSSLMLGVTTYMSTDIASVPLIWIIPLGLYLLTFVLVFSRRTKISHHLVLRWFPLIVVPVAMLIAMRASTPMYYVIPVHLLGFWVVSMACHGELALDRPAREHLTEFYLWISVGGMLGGIFNALIAPVLFNQAIEYALALMLACWLIPRVGQEKTVVQWTFRDILMPGIFGLALLGSIHLYEIIRLEQKVPPEVLSFLIFAIPAVFCFSFQRRLTRFSLGIGFYMLAGLLFYFGEEEPLEIRRSFFGVNRVSVDRRKNLRQLIHGSTIHGQQSLDPRRRREPLAYYHRSGPIGQVFHQVDRLNSPALHVGVVGLGAGTLAAYAQPGQHWDFYEIDAVVRAIATRPDYFSFLHDCRAESQIIMGDGRLSLMKAANRSYGLLVLDVFSSDSVPVHVITEEALRMYLSKLREDGMLAFNISCRYLDLEPLFVSLAHSLNLAGVSQYNSVVLGEEMNGKLPSQWVVLGRNSSDLAALLQDSRWHQLKDGPHSVRVWTDDFSNIVDVLRGI